MPFARRHSASEAEARTCSGTWPTPIRGHGRHLVETCRAPSWSCLLGVNHGSLLTMPYRRTENVVRKLAARRDAILAAAGGLAAEGGMTAVQIAPVAKRAGIAAGTVYRYFPSKTALVSA